MTQQKIEFVARCLQVQHFIQTLGNHAIYFQRCWRINNEVYVSTKSSCIPALHSHRAVLGLSKIVNQFCESLLCKQLMSTCSIPTASNTWAEHTASCWRAFTSLDNKVDRHPQIHKRTVQDVVVGNISFTYWIKTHQLHKNQDKSTYPAIIIIQSLCTLQLKVHHP